MRFLRAFASFWYDFIIGDDWKIAAAVVLSVGLAIAVQATGVLGDAGVAVIGGVVILGAFAVSLVIDVAGSHRER